jgi:hypothetical protein
MMSIKKAVGGTQDEEKTTMSAWVWTHLQSH